MNKSSHRIETDDSGGESHALDFASGFKWGLPVIVLLCFVMVLVSISFQQNRPAMTLLHQYLPELATAVDVADASPGPIKIPTPDDIIIQSLTSKWDGNLVRNPDVAGATGLQIDIWRTGHLGVTYILDTGPGISVDARQTLFQAFKTIKSGGTRIGLAIA
jgi:hypothetical protein